MLRHIMKSISHLATILMNTILTISVNSSCMEKQTLCPSNQFHYQNLMNSIIKKQYNKDIRQYYATIFPKRLI